MAAVAQHWTSAQARAAAVGVVRRLQDAGHTAYFAGGCVRDELLGREPLDYDVATDARPEAIQKLFRRTAAVGASFGVVLVREHGGVVEVATFRSDGPYSDRRRPDTVEFADAVHDAERRDFTINALFLDPLAAEDSADIHGHIIDHVGGRADLGRRVIRAVGEPERRLAEDHLRALRAVRFAARFGFTIEAGTAEAIRRHAGDLAGVSRERIGDELRRMLADSSRCVAVGLLDELELDGQVLGAVVGDAQPGPPAPGGAVLAAVGANERDVTLPAALAAIAFDRGELGSAARVPGLLQRWRRGLCLSNDEMDRLRQVLHGAIELREAWAGLPVSARKRRASSGWFSEALIVATAVDQASGEQGGAGLGERVLADVRALEADGVGLAPESLLDGHDMLGLGLAPGPVFARVLSAVYDAQLEGVVRDKSMALRMAAELAGGGSV